MLAVIKFDDAVTLFEKPVYILLVGVPADLFAGEILEVDDSHPLAVLVQGRLFCLRGGVADSGVECHAFPCVFAGEGCEGQDCGEEKQIFQ